MAIVRYLPWGKKLAEFHFTLPETQAQGSLSRPGAESELDSSTGAAPSPPKPGADGRVRPSLLCFCFLLLWQWGARGGRGAVPSHLWTVAVPPTFLSRAVNMVLHKHLVQNHSGLPAHGNQWATSSPA